MDTSHHVEKAEEAVRRKNFDFAVALYRQLLEIRPDDGGARRGLHRALRARHDYRPTPKALAAVTGAFPRLLGRVFLLARSPARAAASYEQAFALNPRNASVGYRVGDCLERAGHLDSALAVFEALAESDAAGVEPMKRAGALAYRKRDLPRALEFYERALKIRPLDQDALKARKDLTAEGALARGRYESGRSSRELRSEKDKEASREAERGHRVVRSAEELGGDIARLREQRGKSPEDARLAESLGRALAERGDLEGAIAALEDAARLAPDAYEVRVALGDARIRRAESALAAARSAAAKGGAAAGASPGELERARVAVELAEIAWRVSAHPTDMGLRVRHARLLEEAGRVDEAIGEYQRTVADPRWKNDAMLGLGRAFERKGLHDLARKQLERALEAVGTSDSRAKEILYTLGALCEKLGSRGDARGYYARIYEVDIGFRDVAAKMETLKA
ncbi:MAG TPA: tetratricopeptide repeat protein [Planctomycetota bacterium]|jgi:tetratricopeptide (TPR) repeat protein|nr:tetratricopeptide repeat protein [Planctomycetota bacterium]